MIEISSLSASAKKHLLVLQRSFIYQTNGKKQKWMNKCKEMWISVAKQKQSW